MKTVIAVLFALFLFGNPALGAEDDISFVASFDELQNAVSKKDGIRGLAVSMKFYDASDQTVRGQIKDLITNVKKLSHRPIYIYGQPLESEQVNALLGSSNLVGGCKPMFFGGIWPTKHADGSEAVVDMCGADDKSRTEEWLKNFISNDWRRLKLYWKKHGYEVLD
ncbi:hypothetical protein A3G55_00080 [Candidatus Giovannonibacteria bacterium RIFCSPLOWO2_12_FULL_44_25]|uniref:Uncharacterized protein n=4 Tax=Parcubacteria group TaxID=1794811 RepID=A0A837IH31_9BACT|nr:MAG: hypothetical protein UW15_C0013G0014 [Parcubacteria group bacterium GW2011_GWC1_44_10]KKT57326.1 MAG: hypothetical protein UW49_C0005G0014 [Candidatus Giovannonibacteria bacterium GW2011_GWB1_44_23]KKT59674.1 MAG: hypothetical protein UW53_C0009G0014 [Candidatus Giovannonibacteria bacterium GW2011_GWA1_44_25]KKU12986.1 MAG: hypothetical protein UX18_C0004G0002 [Candidatus Azambacteria bacterium GW2011_GWC2_45_7b]OGF50051.1 MAG: hypothetical protein A2120_02890 [Candidatus Giovannonibact